MGGVQKGTTGNIFKVLKTIAAAPKGLKTTELNGLLHFEVKSCLLSLTKASLIKQSKKYEPYFVTSQGATLLKDKGIVLAMEASAKKPGAPKNGKITNGVTKLTKPVSMTVAMFDELSREHVLAERRAEAIENLLHTWPR